MDLSNNPELWDQTATSLLQKLNNEYLRKASLDVTESIHILRQRNITAARLRELMDGVILEKDDIYALRDAVSCYAII